MATQITITNIPDEVRDEICHSGGAARSDLG